MKLSLADYKEADRCFIELYTLSKELIGIIKQHLFTGNEKLIRNLLGTEEGSDVIEDACIFLLKLFITEQQVLNVHRSQMRIMFGEFPLNVCNKIFTVISEMQSILDDDCKNFIINGNQVNKNRKRWGDHIKVKLPIVENSKNLEKLEDLAKDLRIDNENEYEFTMDYAAFEPMPGGSKDEFFTVDKYSRAWLTEQFTEDLGVYILELIRGNKTNEELQNELFDLLGFDKFEQIQSILENRQQILKTIDFNDKKEFLIKTKPSTSNLPKELRPTIQSQVIVQSLQEKQLLKQVRRDEKKLRSIRNAIGNESDEEDELSMAQVKMMEQQTLLNLVQRKPIFKEPQLRRVQQSAPKYPFVFDSQNLAKSHVGFISGAKLLLPESADRQDNKMYEEITIPAVPSSSLEVGNERIKISSLDDIGQLAFQHTKELNRIQSVVFQTAYYTNHNLLVCAPTGAGKTNVAMLTIVNIIRAHTDQGVIHRDQFKIVYVAPMKALAAEMVQNFTKRLQPLGITIRELTGDMQLTKSEMQQTQILVTTPEKWDVVTRKGAGDIALISLVKLLIIDEVHLLHGERGPVVEALVARTLRLVESSQSLIRIVGLSATLPNYIDVATFLRVNPMIGLFYFDSRFRPVPLCQKFIGVKALKTLQQLSDMDTVCYEKCLELVKDGHQVMIFVHARNATVRTATILKELAGQKGQLSMFKPEDNTGYGLAQKAISKSRNKQLVDLFQSGFAMHHAGMLRTDRSLVEKYFTEGHIKVLVCTATLAWGVNLPAHGVIIKGTEIYDSKQGTFVDLGILDVLQIFGRAGRPQFDTSGIGTIITTHDKLNHYLSLLTNQFPIESNFIECLADNLNAEIALGTISNVDDGIEWLSYTYLFCRMKKNPLVYGLTYGDIEEDRTLEIRRRDLIMTSAMKLDKAQMIRFNERTLDLNITDLGRTASHFYIKYDTVEIFNEMLRPMMTEAEILAMMSNAQEFHQLKVRDEEMDELDQLLHNYCNVVVRGGTENVHGKVNTLMQTYLSRGFVNSFSLVSDLSYITQNAARIARALFTIELRRNNAILASRLLMVSKMFERQMWDFESPLRQFHILPLNIIEKIENRGFSIYALREMDSKEIGQILHNQKLASTVSRCAEEFPMLDIDASLQPITRLVLRIRVNLKASFRWNDKVHGKHSEAFWVWIEDPESNYIYHSEHVQITKRQVIRDEPVELVMTIPLREPLPTQYYVKAVSDAWLGSHFTCPLSFKHLILPELHPPHTELLPCQPLPLSVLEDNSFQSLYNFTHFNPIQTQIFHCLYHSDNNVLLGAPTGSGKTIAAEIAIFRVFKKYPEGKVVYIAPLKALVRERIEDWKVRFEQKLNKKVVELTGDVSPDIQSIRKSQVIVTTPEKWDGISRSWQTRDYVRDVVLLIIDEIHLLGEDRGPVLEVIVSRTNFIASHTERTLRIIGLSTALANAKDLANWLGIGQMGLYNFKPSVRPVPLSVHISGFPGKHYCPRMATMNKTVFQSIRQHSPATPALIFVSSRRQTRLTALDLITFLATTNNPKQFLHMPEDQLDQLLANVKDNNLKLTLAFGIGLHHAGLQEQDRKMCEELFLNRKIQILIATATLAWGVNLPAHLVIVKGTEYYDGKLKRYVDMPITDVLQMMGRAGRPQFGNEGVAVVLVHDVKKNFYKQFLYSPFPVESSLLPVLPDHINAEVVAGTVHSKQSCLDYLTWTYFFHRLLQNPSYYELSSIEPEDVNQYLSLLVDRVMQTLDQAGCIYFDNDNRSIYPTSMGRISSFYYLSHQSMRHFADNLRPDMKWEEILRCMCDAYEFYQQPVRHNEDKYNE